MKRHNILIKSFLFLLTFVLASHSFAYIQTGYIVIRVQFSEDSWQVIEAPKLIPCAMKEPDLALTAIHSILIGYDAANQQVTEYRFPNPRAQIGDLGSDLAADVVTDIFIPADAGMTSLIFREQWDDGAGNSLVIDLSTVVPEPVECNAPVYELFPTPTEVEEGEVLP